MKGLFLIPFLLLVSSSMATCGDRNESQFSPEQPGIPQQSSDDDDSEILMPGGNGRYLVLYVSRTSNTEQVAQLIQNELNCDLLEVEPETPYETDYNAMLERAQEELAAIRQGNYPPVRTSIGSFEDYDILFVGYPIWYGSMATPMQTFLHEHAVKLAGKQVALFATSGSSGISGSVGEARMLCPDATLIDQTLLLTSSDLLQMESRVQTWLEMIGAGRHGQETPGEASLKIEIMVGNRTIHATLEDHAAGRDFLSRLPLEVTLEDYNNTTEKIFYPSPALTIEGVMRGCAPEPGDITIYEPWGNVAIFCKSWPCSDDLIKIGHIDDEDIEALSVSGDIRVRIEKP